ncbi:autotransporter-associated N-terminal domain-containing protein [Fusobacterium hwasookii]|nr:autotransporter-associated N-terminal domain-containing protein [Fusobacterium hwasookii]
MLGTSAFSEEVNNVQTNEVPTREEIASSRENLKNSVGNLQAKIDQARAENSKGLTGLRLELTQLMEQGDQVVKSPWMSWQFGANYMYNKWNGAYKGRGDKAQKYPFEGVFERDTNLFNRYMPTTSDNYSLLPKSSNPRSAASNARQGLSNYGLASNVPVLEPPVETEVNAGINPKSINKVPLNIAAKTANSPTLPEAVKFAPIDPKIVIPADPALPVPPTFAIVLGADCNVGCNSGDSSNGGLRQQRRAGFNLNGRAKDSIQSILHYTWFSGSAGESGYAFKMYTDTGGNFTLGTDIPNSTNGLTTPAGNNVYFNSYNFGDNDEFGVIANSQGIERNHQHFFVGGSRFIESDNSGTNTIKIPNGYKVNLGGILTLGLVSQGHDTTQLNQGTITDAEEKDDNWIKNMPYDTTGPGAGKYLTIKGPAEYHIKRSADGYVGYKVAIALVQEDGVAGGKILNDTDGIIDFRGERSIGLYTYLPSYNSNRPMINKGKILLSGAESYGMKFAAKEDTGASVDFINDTDATIALRKNPDGSDTADNAAAMAIMEDASVSGGVKLSAGKAQNKGNITITDVKNSLGTYVNINSDITNTSTGKININSTIAGLTEAEKAAGKEQPVNIGMRADTDANAKVINNGEITIDGAYAIGMLANGSKLVNTKKISSTDIKNGVGIVGINNAVVENRGTIKVVGTGNTNNIGVFLNSGSTGTVGTIPAGDPAPSVEVSGDNSTGVLVTGTGSSLTMKGNVTVSGNSVTGIVANGTTVKLEDDATVKVNNNGAVAGEIDKKGSYGIVVKGATGKFEGTGTTADVKVTTDKSIGLYSEGTLTVKKANVTATEGAINFFAKNGTININNGGTTETGQKSLLFYTSGTGKVVLGGQLDATIKGGTTPSTRGTAFYYVSPTRYGTFDTNAIQTYFNNTFGNGTSTLNHLKLNMEQGSRLFVASNVGMNLSNTSATNLMTGITNAPTITGSGYKTFMLYLSKLTIDQAVDLNDPNSNYAQLEIANSSIENASVMTGTQNRQVAIAQENGNDTSGNGYNATEVTLTNTASGTINLTGEESTGIYAKRGLISNAGNISVGKKSTAIYLVEDDRSPASATAGARAINESTGVITIGEDSTGIFYKVEPDNADGKGTNTGIGGGVSNDGKIVSSANNVIAISFDSPYASKTVKNEQTGEIDLQGQNSTGIFATGAGTYAAINDGKIKLASSTNVNTPNIAMYTDKDTITLENNGTIEGGDKTVGIYGHNVNLGANSVTKIGSGGTGVYSKGGNVTINGGTLSIGENGVEGSNDAVGVYYVGAGGTIINNAANVNIGDSAYGFVVQNENGAAVTLTTNTPTVTLKNDAVYAYSNNRAGSVTNSSVLNSTGNGNYGIYSAGSVTNNAQINFGTGIGNVGVYSILGGTATNNSVITIGASDAATEKFGIGMAAGYRSSDSGNVINSSTGVINVNGKNSIGMYATGPLSTATNKGTINLSGDNSVGMYLDNGATGVNEGTITTVGSPKGVKGVVLSNNSKFINRAGARININSAEGYGLFRVNSPEANITVVNYGDITVSGGATASGEFDPTGGKPLEKTAGGVSLKSPKGTNDINITVNGKPVPNVERVTEPIGNRGDALISSLGMYVDTLRGTNPINGLSNLNVKKAELLYGIEAAENSTSKYFEVSGNILKPYQDAVRTAQGIKWSHNSASLTWMALPTVDANGVPLKVGMAKIPYTEFAGKEPTPVEVTDTYNFLDGLEQRYGVEGIGTRENQVFQKLNSIGNNEATLFFQATDEMMGHQYANVQQRINATGNILDKEFDYLRGEWQTASKDSNKIKTFGTRGDYKTETAGVIDYKYNAYGVAYVHENEDIKLGRGIGWYSGIVHNRIKFKDIGRSREDQLQGKVGLYKSVPFDDNNSLNWTISGDIFVGRNRMHRRFLVVDEVFHAKARYYNYGISIKNEIGKEFRLSESFTLRPYAALDLEYGRISKIREKSGEIKLEVKQNQYFSVKPELGAELAFKHYFGRKTLKVGLGAAYENELGRVANGKNKARVADTTADWFNIRSEKEDRRGNVKFDLNLGLDNQRFGVTGNVGYDTKGQNIRGGLGLRVIF